MGFDDPRTFIGFDDMSGPGAGVADSRARFIASVYGLMAVGVAVSAAAALLVARNTPLRDALFAQDGMTLMGWAVTVAPLAIVFAFTQVVTRLSADAARAIFFVYAALVGASLADILLVFTQGSVAETLAGVAIGFGALAIAGARLKTDLSGARTFMTFTLFGLLAATILNLFIGSAHIDLGLSLLIVLFFSFATLHDAQRLERVYEEEAGTGMLEKGAILGALTLYLDLLNPFVAMLRIVGRRR